MFASYAGVRFSRWVHACGAYESVYACAGQRERTNSELVPCIIKNCQHLKKCHKVTCGIKRIVTGHSYQQVNHCLGNLKCGMVAW